MFPLFLKGPNPQKQGPNFNQNKVPHLGSRYIYIYLSLSIYIYVYIHPKSSSHTETEVYFLVFDR